MTAQTEPQAPPETGEDDADRRATEATREIQTAFGNKRAHYCWDHKPGDCEMIDSVAKAIRAAVEAEREGHEQFAHELAEALDVIVQRIRARGEAS